MGSNLQILNGILDGRYGGQRTIELHQSGLEVGRNGDVRQRIKTRDIELRRLNIAKRVDFVYGVHGALNGGVKRSSVILET